MSAPGQERHFALQKRPGRSTASTATKPIAAARTKPTSTHIFGHLCGGLPQRMANLSSHTERGVSRTPASIARPSLMQVCGAMNSRRFVNASYWTRRLRPIRYHVPAWGSGSWLWKPISRPQHQGEWTFRTASIDVGEM